LQYALAFPRKSGYDKLSIGLPHEAENWPGGRQMSKDILSIIQANISSFSKGQKLIANFILTNYDKAAFMTASKLGKTVNVSESTVVRFSAELGYDGYPSMQKALQEMIRNKLTSIQRIEVSNDRIGNQDILSMVMQSDIEKIRMTLEETDRVSFDESVEAIVSARRIYILGVRSSSAIAGFLGFYFNLIFDNVVLVNTTSASEIFEQILRVGEGDVVIGVSFPRYSRRTVKAMEFACNRNATVIAITDSKVSPLWETATYTLLAKSDMASFVDSLVAPLSLVNALIVAVGRKKDEDLSKTFETLEQIWDEYEVYEKVED
jgi:DNA-binding MurR/RpiR family transcriptional regulator